MVYPHPHELDMAFQVVHPKGGRDWTVASSEELVS